jgi:hypothetical protein
MFPASNSLYEPKIRKPKIMNKPIPQITAATAVAIIAVVTAVSLLRPAKKSKELSPTELASPPHAHALDPDKLDSQGSPAETYENQP